MPQGEVTLHVVSSGYSSVVRNSLSVWSHTSGQSAVGAGVVVGTAVGAGIVGAGVVGAGVVGTADGADVDGAGVRPRAGQTSTECQMASIPSSSS